MNDITAVRLVARREIRERMRSRAFKVGTGVMLALVIGLVAVFSLTGNGGTTSYDVGTVAGVQSAVLQNAQRQQGRFDAKLTAKPYPGESALRKAVEDDDVDAGLTGSKLLAGAKSPDELVALLQASAQSGPPAVALERIGKQDDAGAGLAFVGTLLLYISLLTFGYVLASGIVEEKSSRVVEILLSATRPTQLLAGKVIGIGVVGLVQMLSVVIVGVAAAKAAGRLDLPAATVGGAALVVVYFVLGYAFYAMAFAATASLVSRQEDIQSVTTPISIVLIAGYILSISVSSDPNSTLATIGTYLPPIAPMIVPGIALQGELSTTALAVSIALMIVGIALMLFIAARIYRHAIMWTGAPVSYRRALRVLRPGAGPDGVAR